MALRCICLLIFHYDILASVNIYDWCQHLQTSNFVQAWINELLVATDLNFRRLGTYKLYWFKEHKQQCYTLVSKWYHIKTLLSNRCRNSCNIDLNTLFSFFRLRACNFDRCCELQLFRVARAGQNLGNGSWNLTLNLNITCFCFA